LAQRSRPLRILYCIGKAEFARFATEGKSPNASTVYRVVMPLMKLMETGRFECRISDEFQMMNGTLAPDKYNPNIGWCDIVVFPRLINIDPAAIGPIIRSLKFRGKIVAYEHDDYYFELSRSTYNRHTFTGDQLEATRIAMREADLVTAPNGYLIERSMAAAGREKPPISRVIPNAVSMEEWEEAAKLRKPHGNVRILLSGAYNHYLDWIGIFPAVKRIKDKFAEGVEIHVQGVDRRRIPTLKGDKGFTPHFYYDSLELVEKYSSLGTVWHEPTDLQGYPSMLNAISPDIGLIVTGDAVFDMCKSTLKFIDYTMAGAATVCSANLPYVAEIGSAETCFATSEADWVTAIEALVIDPGMRRRKLERSIDKVKEKYSLEAVAPLWAEAFEAAYVAKYGNAIIVA
jgi:hypothetical protein